MSPLSYHEPLNQGEFSEIVNVTKYKIYEEVTLILLSCLICNLF